MADFTSLTLELNTGTQATPVWTNVLGASKETRFLDVNSGGGTTASASWPAVTRPASGTAAVDYIYAYTADATGLGLWGTTSATPAAWALANFLMARWNWDNTGTFASAPIITAYPTTAHGAITRGDGSLLGGHASDTGATARSYLKAIAYGANTAAMPAAPASAAGAAPVVTDGSTGAVTFAGAAAWSTVQGLQGDNDYIQYGATPSAVTAAVWYWVFRMFMGANETPGLFTGPFSLKYTWT